MKKRFLKYIVALSVLCVIIALIPRDEKEKAEVLSEVIKISLDNYHYDPHTLNDDFSADVFDIYLERLDYS